MDYQESNAAFVAKRAECLNLDRLLKVFVVEYSAKDLRRDLMEIYFRTVNATALSGECPGDFGSALVTLQEIIEAVDAMDDPEEKYLEVRAL